MSKDLAASQTASELPMLLWGLATCATTVMLMSASARYLNLDIPSFTAWFVIPVGAIFAGCAGSSGIAIAAYQRHQPPSNRMAWNMVTLALSTYWVSAYLTYRELRYEGLPISAHLSFWQYYQLAVTKAEYVTDLGWNLGEVGILGYPLAALQVFGFILGGWAAWVILTKQPYCDNCRRYYEKRQLLSGANEAELERYISKLPLTFPNLITQLVHTIGTKHYSGLGLTFYTCALCPNKLFVFSVEIQKQVKEVATYPYHGAVRLPDPRGG